MLKLSSALLSQRSQETRDRLSDSGFASAVESDRATQRAAEARWVRSEVYAAGGFFAKHRRATTSLNSLASSSTSPTPPPMSPPMSPTTILPPRRVIGGAYELGCLSADDLDGCDIYIIGRQTSIASATEFLSAMNSARVGVERRLRNYTVVTFIHHDKAAERHSAFAGAFALNSVRYEVPSFPLVVAIAEPRDNVDGSSSASIKIILEGDIWLCPTLADLLPSMTPGQVFLVAMQLARALGRANELVGYTNYSLDASTILMRPIDGGGGGGAGNSFVAVGDLAVAAPFGVAVIVDNRDAHVTVRNSAGRDVSFGACGSAMTGGDSVAVGIYRDRSHPMSDVFRICLDLAARDGSSGIVGNALLKHFTPNEEHTTVVAAVASRRLPHARETLGLTMSGFEKWARRIARPAGAGWHEARAGVIEASKAPAGSVLPFAAGLCGAPFAVDARLVAMPSSCLGFADINHAILRIGGDASSVLRHGLANAFIDTTDVVGSTTTTSGKSPLDRAIAETTATIATAFADARAATVILKTVASPEPSGVRSLASAIVSSLVVIAFAGRVAAVLSKLFWEGGGGGADDDVPTAAVIAAADEALDALNASARAATVIASQDAMTNAMVAGVTAEIGTGSGEPPPLTPTAS